MVLGSEEAVSLAQAIGKAAEKADEIVQGQGEAAQAEQRRRGEIIAFLNSFQAQVHSDEQLRVNIEKLVSTTGKIHYPAGPLYNKGLNDIRDIKVIPLLDGYQDNAPPALCLISTGLAVITLGHDSYRLIRDPRTEQDWEKGRVFEANDPDRRPYTAGSLAQMLSNAIQKTVKGTSK